MTKFWNAKRLARLLLYWWRSIKAPKNMVRLFSQTLTPGSAVFQQNNMLLPSAIWVGGPLQALFLGYFFTSVCRHFKTLRRPYFYHLWPLKKNVNTYRQIRDKQILVLDLFAICINELVFPTWFLIFLYKMLGIIV